jgi:hypothetical protein
VHQWTYTSIMHVLMVLRTVPYLLINMRDTTDE